MKNKLKNFAKSIFNRDDWDPNSISGLGDWEINAFEVNPTVTNKRKPRGVPHSTLPLAERLKKVQADLEAFEDSLPDLKEIQS